MLSMLQVILVFSSRLGYALTSWKSLIFGSSFGTAFVPLRIVEALM